MKMAAEMPARNMPAADMPAECPAVVDDLRGAIARSGGHTSRAFLLEWSRQPLDWAQVTGVPVDDRWLPAHHLRSNERLLRKVRA